MNKTIEYYKQNNYGVSYNYIADKATAGIVSQLTGRKTLTNLDMNALLRLGFEFKEITKSS